MEYGFGKLSHSVNLNIASVLRNPSAQDPINGPYNETADKYSPQSHTLFLYDPV
jgi:hypothetical protein